MLQEDSEHFKNYVKNFRNCPNCGTYGSLAYDGIDVDDGTASQGVYCTECESSWTEVFELDGIGTWDGEAHKYHYIKVRGD